VHVQQRAGDTVDRLAMQVGRVDHLALGQLDRVGDRLDVEVDLAVRRGADIVDALPGGSDRGGHACLLSCVFGVFGARWLASRRAVARLIGLRGARKAASCTWPPLGAEPVPAGGNTTNASFVVTVPRAQEQLAQLVHEVVDATSLPPRLGATDREAAIAHRGLRPDQSTAARERPSRGEGIHDRRPVPRPARPSRQWTADANCIRAVLAC
jgi:hypothetical protein